MAVICVHGPLRKPLGERPEREVAGDSVIELLRGLERERPEMGGRILDERGLIRRHINVFVNGERGHKDTPVGAADRVEVLPAITGG